MGAVSILLAIAALIIYFIFRIYKWKWLLKQRVYGHIAVITGAASGIGLETSLMLAKRGWRVFAVDINEDGLNDLHIRAQKLKLSIRTEVCNILDTKSCDALLERLQEDSDIQERGIDVLVNNAGVIIPCPVLETPWDKVHQMFGVNILGPIYLCKIFIGDLLKGPRGGRIINISSLAGTSAWPWQGVYSCTKYSLEGFSSTLRREALGAGLNLKVCVINPGGVKTPLAEGVFDARRNWLSSHTQSPFYIGASKSLQRMLNAVKLNSLFLIEPKDVAEVICVAAIDKHPQYRYEPGTIPMNLMRWLLMYLPSSLADKMTTHF